MLAMLLWLIPGYPSGSARSDFQSSRNAVQHHRSAIEQREVDDIDPAEDAVDNRPQYRVVGVVGNRHRQGRAKAGPVLRPLHADAVSPPSVHRLLLSGLRVYRIGRDAQ